MVYRGKVLKVEKDHVIVVTEDIMYFKLHPKKCTQGKPIIFVEDDIMKEKAVPVYKNKLMAAVITILILSASIISGVAVWDNYSYAAIVGLDIKPAIEFMIDENDIVKRVRPASEYGKEIISVEMKGMKIEEAIPMALDIAAKKDYIKGETEKIEVSRMEKDGSLGNVDEIKKIVEEWSRENERQKASGKMHTQPGPEKEKNTDTGNADKNIDENAFEYKSAEKESSKGTLKHENKIELKQKLKEQRQSEKELQKNDNAQKYSEPSENKDINQGNKPGGNDVEKKNIDNNAGKKTKGEEPEVSESQKIETGKDASVNGNRGDVNRKSKEPKADETKKQESKQKKEDKRQKK